MEFTVDRIAFVKKIKGINRIAPDAEQINFTINDEDQLVIEPVAEDEYHCTKLTADVLEDGAFGLSKKDVLKILDNVDGPTITLTREEDTIQLTTENTTLNFPRLEIEITREPTYIVMGSIDSAVLRQGLMPIKEVVGKKSEKGTEQLLDALVILDQTTLRVSSTNRISFFDMSIPLQNSQFTTEESYSVVPLKWAGLAELEEKNTLELIANETHLGFATSESIALFKKQRPNQLLSLAAITNEISSDHYPYTQVEVNKKKIVSALNTLKKEKLFAQIEFANQQLKIVGIDITGAEMQQKMSFSVDFEGETSVKSLTVDPTHFMKIIKNIKDNTATLHLPKEDTWLPIRVQSSDTNLELMGLTMCTEIIRNA